MDEFLRKLNEPAPRVKEELQEDDLRDLVFDGESVSALDKMGEEFEKQKRKEAEDAKIVQEARTASVGQFKEPPPKRTKKGGKRTRSEEDEGRDEKRLTLAKEKERGPLTTFGHSSRPRRSVNYASIERGEEAQAQSLVTELHGKRKNKRTRDEMDENWTNDDAAAAAAKKRTNYAINPRTRRTPWLPPGKPIGPSTSSPPSSSFLTPTALSAWEESRAQMEFANVTPQVDEERPPAEHRTVGKGLDATQAVRRSSGGFRRFIAWISDERLIRIFETVKARYLISEDDELRVLKSLRHVYNSMPLSYKRNWEFAAKMDIFESRSFAPGVPMPFSEIPLVPANVQTKQIPRGAFEANCCSMRPTWSSMLEAAEHYLQHHDTVHLFGCDACTKLFSSKYELTRHDCDAFRTHLLSLMMDGKQLTFEAAHLYLCCTQCGLWLPVKLYAAEHKGWPYFATSMMNHSCQPMVCILVFFRKPLPDENTRMTFQMLSHVDIGFPLKCDICHDPEPFKSVKEAEEHYMQHRKLACNKCPKVFGTEFSYRHHLHDHIAQSAQFSNYLMYSATYQPPPNSGRRPHVGFLTDIPAVGGFEANQVAALEAVDCEREFVQPHENTMRKKLLRWKNEAAIAKKKASRRKNGENEASEHFSSSSSTSADENGEESAQARPKRRTKTAKASKVRPDLGYEHIDRKTLFGRDEKEQEAMEKLQTMMNDRIFTAADRLLEPEEALAVLAEAAEKPPKLPALQCPFADELALKVVRTVTLPASNCIDPLKDQLPLNRVFFYCPKCVLVGCSDPKMHGAHCGTDEDDIEILFHGASSPHAGVRCLDPSCDLHICSVASLRIHCQLVHGISVIMEPPPHYVENPRDPNFYNRYDRSLMALAKYFNDFVVDPRTPVAKMTDLDCRLPPMGRLVLRAKSDVRVMPTRFPVQTKQHVQPNNGFVQHQRPQVPAPTRKPGNFIWPFKTPKTNRWFSCSFCEVECEHGEKFVEHLLRAHLALCPACAHGYANPAFKRTHYCSKKFADVGRGKMGSNLSGQCPFCTGRFAIEKLYEHLLRNHFDECKYVVTTGEFHPLPVDPRIDDFRSEYREKCIRMDLEPVHGLTYKQVYMRSTPIGAFPLVPPDPKSLDPRLMCYLCELTFDSVAELTEHLGEHVEKFSSCPFCGIKIASHFHMQQHMREQHVQMGPYGTQNCCQWCHEPQNRYIYSHMLFRCQYRPICTICGQKSLDPSTVWQHMQRQHGSSIFRFKCGHCMENFISMGEYYEHACSASPLRMFKCDCDDERYFKTVANFLDHFDSCHVSGGNTNTCDMCQCSFGSQELLARHRNTHKKSEIPKHNWRKVFITMESFFPKRDSGYIRYVEGGRAPPSYMRKDRSEMDYLMGETGDLPIDEPAHTLAALPRPPRPENVVRASEYFASKGSIPRPVVPSQRTVQHKPPQTQRLPLTQPRIPPPPQKHVRPAVVKPILPTEVIELSDDDEEDDDDIVIVKDTNAENAVHNDNSGEPPAKRATVPTLENQISSQISVRVEEEHRDGYGGTEQPGYVVEDNDLEVTGQTTPTHTDTPVLKVVQDELGDEELAVVAEVEHPSGTLPSGVAAAREKTLKCTQCSSTFYTSRALKSHAEGHKMDAGAQICQETYGLPVDARAWICRNCSLAFEDRLTFDKHIAIHGDTIHPCHMCSGISFNGNTSHNHAQAHQKKAALYACGTCLMKFQSDLFLADHLLNVHSVQHFYFCKVCAFGATDLNAVFEHCTTFHDGHSYALAQRIGASPVQLFNYQPRNEEEFRANVAKNLIRLHTPSDCSHRSMLLNSEVLVACKTCFCTQTWFSFLAFNGYSEETGFPQFRVMDVPADARRLFPLIHHLSNANEAQMRKHGTARTFPGRPAAQQHSTRTPRTARRVVAPVPPVGTKAPKGARILLPITTVPADQPTTSSAIPPHRLTGITTNRSVPTPPQRRTVQSAAPPQRPLLAAGHASTDQQQQQAVKAVATKNPHKCMECDGLITTEFDAFLHRMHNSTDTWLCRWCGFSRTSEIDLFQHYLQEHLTPAFKKYKDEGFKSNIFQLTCAFPNCKHQVFSSPAAFNRHLTVFHESVLPHVSQCCETRFTTTELCERHEQEHFKYSELNGTDAQCCPICGTMEMWSLPKDRSTDSLQSHLVRHGLDFRVACRGCMQQFSADVYRSAAMEHMHEKHCTTSQADGKRTCQICGEMGMNDEQFARHCKDAHLFNILLKSHLSTRGELVVTTGAEYQNYVGLKVAGRTQSTVKRTILPSTSSAPSTSTSTSSSSAQPTGPPTRNPITVSLADGGNAALLSIAASIVGDQ
ncbi:unnamed protein product [Caenorhabditis sp. 36 PRJEB53466]|nr:unnamed protein product [Caenorhabditis sp. 36 PRJEB53466]